jgi:hypothetical protein
MTVQSRYGGVKNKMREAKRRKARPLQASDLNGPLELYLFNPESALRAALAGELELARWQSQVVHAVTRRIANRSLKPLRCMTCDHAFAAVPKHLGFVKRVSGPTSLTMAFCPVCAALPPEILKQRICARLGAEEAVAADCGESQGAAPEKNSIVIGDDGLISNLCGVVIEDLPSRRNVTENLRCLTMAALAVQGAAALDAPMEHAAAHEAGHCVVAQALGFRPQSSLIRQDEQGRWGGWTVWGEGAWNVDQTTSAEADWRGVAVLIAGCAAEHFAADRPRLSSSLDEWLAHDLLCGGIANKLEGRPDPRIVGVISKVTVLNVLHDRRQALDRITAALIERSVLDAGELQALLIDAPDRAEELTRQFFAKVIEAGSDQRFAATLDALQESPDALVSAMHELDQQRRRGGMKNG